MEIDIRIKVEEPKFIPSKKNLNDAGYDLRANVDTEITLFYRQIRLIPLGIFSAFSPEYRIDIRPRSGLAYKHGITILNTPGTIDADYRDEWKVILYNTKEKPFKINRYDRICQMIIEESHSGIFHVVNNLEETERKGGFGHTGIK